MRLAPENPAVTSGSTRAARRPFGALVVKNSGPAMGR